MEPKTVLLSLSLMAASATANAQGEFSFGAIPGLDLEPTVEIDLNPTMLGMLGAAANAADPQAASALEGITSVRVYVYEGIGDELQDVLAFVERTSMSLESAGWHPAVRVREQGEQVRVYMKPSAPGPNGAAGTLDGITVMVTDSGTGDEAVFVNIAGKIRPETLGKVVGTFGMQGVLNGVPGVSIPQAPENDEP
jgi:hypothetical protein